MSESIGESSEMYPIEDIVDQHWDTISTLQIDPNNLDVDDIDWGISIIVSQKKSNSEVPEISEEVIRRAVQRALETFNSETDPEDIEAFSEAIERRREKAKNDRNHSLRSMVPDEYPQKEFFRKLNIAMQGSTLEENTTKYTISEFYQFLEKCAVEHLAEHPEHSRENINVDEIFFKFCVLVGTQARKAILDLSDLPDKVMCGSVATDIHLDIGGAIHGKFFSK